MLVEELCREHGIGDSTFYKCRAKYGGMDASLIPRMKELEEENHYLKKMYAEEKLKAEINIGSHGKKVVKVAVRKLMAKQAAVTYCLSIASTCRTFRISETYYHNQPKLNEENQLIAERLIGLTQNQRNWGFGLCLSMEL